MTTRQELEAAIVAAPLERGPRMVYGDWLQAQGDPSGAWVAMMAAIEAAPHDTRLRSAAIAYLADHRTELLGPVLAGMASTYLGWLGGFVDEVRLHPSMTGSARDDVWFHPTFRFVRHVTIGYVSYFDALVRQLAAARPPLLDSVLLIDSGSTTARVQVDPLAEVPTLRALALHRAQISKPFPQLRELVVSVETEYSVVIDWLARGPCPELEELTLLHLDGGHASNIVDIVRGAPKLRTLRVIGATGANHLAELLAQQPMQLRTVDFSHSDLNDHGHAHLRRLRPKPEIFAWCTNVSTGTAKAHRATRPRCGVYDIDVDTPRSWLVHRFSEHGRDAVRMLPNVGTPLYRLGTNMILADGAKPRDAIPYLDASATLPASGLYSVQLANAAIAHERAMELDEAELRAREALLHIPDEPNFYAILIDALRRTGRVEAAAAEIPAAVKAIEYPPRHGAHKAAAAAALHDCLLTLGQLGRYGELVKLAARKRCKGHVNADSQAVLAIAQLALGDRAAAKASLDDANRKCTKPIIHHARAAMFAAEGKLAQAKAAVAKARDEGYTAMAWIEADPVLGPFIHAKPAPPAPKSKRAREPDAKPKKKRSAKKPLRRR